jgi:valyl-tRNA synthetase
LDAAKKFANKLWNMARFIEMMREKNFTKSSIHRNLEELTSVKTAFDKEWITKVRDLSEEIAKYIDNYQFNLAAERLYEFIWHEFADVYIEEVKKRNDEGSFYILESLYVIVLKLLHPFMPFVTEAIYQKMPGHGESIMIELYPTSHETKATTTAR